MQHVPIQMRVLRLAQVRVHCASRIGDGPGVQDTETFATEVCFEFVLGDETRGLSGGWGVVGRDG